MLYTMPYIFKMATYLVGSTIKSISPLLEPGLGQMTCFGHWGTHLRMKCKQVMEKGLLSIAAFGTQCRVKKPGWARSVLEMHARSPAFLPCPGSVTGPPGTLQLSPSKCRLGKSLSQATEPPTFFFKKHYFFKASTFSVWFVIQQ